MNAKTEFEAAQETESLQRNCTKEDTREESETSKKNSQTEQRSLTSKPITRFEF